MVPADGIDPIAVRPEFTAPELVFDFGVLLEDLLGSDRFDRLHDPLGLHGRYALDQKMHVILVCTDFEEVDLVPLGDLKADCLQSQIDGFGEHQLSILRWAYDVVDEQRDIV